MPWPSLRTNFPVSERGRIAQCISLACSEGYSPGQKTCEGRLYLLYTNDDLPYIRWAGLPAHSLCYVNRLFSSCEHYSKIAELERGTIINSSMNRVMWTTLKPTSTRTQLRSTELRPQQCGTDIVHFLLACQLPIFLQSVCAAVSGIYEWLMV
jgi:hypothetical protein